MKIKTILARPGVSFVRLLVPVLLSLSFHSAFAVPTGLWIGSPYTGNQVFSDPINACDANNSNYPPHIDPYLGGYKCFGVDEKGGLNYYGLIYPAYWCNGRYEINDCPNVTLPGKNNGDSGQCNGTNPINTGWLGNKHQTERDYTGAGSNALVFERYYKSRATLASWETNNATIVPLNGAWRHTYDRKLIVSTTGRVGAYRPDGKLIEFTTGGIADADVIEKLNKVTNGWNLINANDEIEFYNNSGQLKTITNRAGLVTTLIYYANGMLNKITDAYGHQILLTYDGSNRLSTMTDPSGKLYKYAYDSNGNLEKVTYPSLKDRTYLYENTTYLKALTGITSEDNKRIASWTYDATTGYALSSEHGAQNSGIDKTSIVYNTNGSATITDALGASRTYGYTQVLGVIRNTGVSQSCSTGCSGASNLGYDANGNVNNRTDFNGVQTIYTYDLARNLETSRTEANNTAVARTTTTQWHATFRLPIQIDEPGRQTILDYDTFGNLIQKTITDTTIPKSRIWTYTNTYSSTIPGALTKVVVDGPRTDVIDETTYEYNASGNLFKITNAFSDVTQLSDYDANGRPGKITDPNGVITELTYYPRGWLKSRKVGNESTSYDYYDAGMLQKVTLPNGAFLQYAYDDAQRLTDIYDQLGNHIHYTLDNLGNKTKEEIFDSGNILRQTHSWEFDSLGRLRKDIGANSTEVTQYGDYDNNGNVKTITDAFSKITELQYDLFNRLEFVKDANSKTTQYGYSSLDQLVSVKDPRSLTTTYTINALDDRIKTDSPDSGITNVTFDEAGNVKTRTDAKNQLTQYTYDKLNRVLTETRHDNTVVTYTYDVGTNQKGRLTGITDPSGSTSFQYTLMGRIKQKSQIITNGATLTTSYTYDLTNGQLLTITYPSGSIINYGWTNGVITSVMYGTGQNIVNIATDIKYHPFGQPKQWEFKNGEVIRKIYDLNGRVTSNDTLNTAGIVQSNNVGSLHYDKAGRIDSGYGNTYSYDDLNRLIGHNDGTSYTYTMDDNGNRTYQSAGSTSNTYSIFANNNRINSISAGSITKFYQHDNNGSTTSDGTYTYVYDTVNRLVQAKNGTTVIGTYAYNGLGQRVKKAANGTSTLFAYAEDGKLLGEYNDSSLIQNTVYLGDIPIATIRPGGIVYYIHTDHLNTPRKIRDGNKATRWYWPVATFGATTLNNNPAGLGAFTYNYRFAGQYADTETGIYYNYFRNYDPKTGRYLESDPIGLAGGSFSTYTYVNNNPLNYTDPRGLDNPGMGPYGSSWSGVTLWARPADLGPGGIAGLLVDHYWLQTSTQESGMGPMDGRIPAQDGESSLPGVPVQTIAHNGQSNASNAKQIPIQFRVDEACVNNAIRPGQRLGTFGIKNNCQTFSKEVLNRCRVK